MADPDGAVLATVVVPALTHSAHAAACIRVQRIAGHAHTNGASDSPEIALSRSSTGRGLDLGRMARAASASSHVAARG